MPRNRYRSADPIRDPLQCTELYEDGTVGRVFVLFQHTRRKLTESAEDASFTFNYEPVIEN